MIASSTSSAPISPANGTKAAAKSAGDAKGFGDALEEASGKSNGAGAESTEGEPKADKSATADLPADSGKDVAAAEDADKKAGKKDEPVDGDGTATQAKDKASEQPLLRLLPTDVGETAKASEVGKAQDNNSAEIPPQPATEQPPQPVAGANSERSAAPLTWLRAMLAMGPEEGGKVPQGPAEILQGASSEKPLRRHLQESAATATMKEAAGAAGSAGGQAESAVSRVMPAEVRLQPRTSGPEQSTADGPAVKLDAASAKLAAQAGNGQEAGTERLQPRPAAAALASEAAAPRPEVTRNAGNLSAEGVNAKAASTDISGNKPVSPKIDAAAAQQQPQIRTQVAPNAAAADVPLDASSRQVIDTLTRDLGDVSAQRMVVSTQAAQAGKTVKTMRLQLNPAELGQVNIRLQSVGGELKITIQAESEKTAQMLGKDADAMRSVLRAAGLQTSDISVSAAHRGDQAQPQMQDGSGRGAANQQLAGQQGRGESSGDSRQSFREGRSSGESAQQNRANQSGNGGDRDGDRVLI